MRYLIFLSFLLTGCIKEEELVNIEDLVVSVDSWESEEYLFEGDFFYDFERKSVANDTIETDTYTMLPGDSLFWKTKYVLEFKPDSIILIYTHIYDKYLNRLNMEMEIFEDEVSKIQRKYCFSPGEIYTLEESLGTNDELIKTEFTHFVDLLENHRIKMSGLKDFHNDLLYTNYVNGVLIDNPDELLPLVMIFKPVSF